MVLAKAFHDARLRALVGKVNADQHSPEYAHVSHSCVPLHED
jgi:hypothetical protein